MSLTVDSEHYGRYCQVEATRERWPDHVFNEVWKMREDEMRASGDEVLQMTT